MPRHKRPPTVMTRIRKPTLQKMTEEAKRIGIPKTQFIDNLFKSYKRGLK